MATMEKHTEVVAVADDPAVQEVRRRRDDLRRRLTDADARSVTPWGVSVSETRERREAREEALALRPVLEAAEREVAAAERAARKRIDEAYAAERARLIAAMLDAADRFAASVKVLKDRDDAAVTRGWSRPDPVFGDFADRLAIERERLRDKPAAPAELPKGKVRLRLTVNLHNDLLFHLSGDVVDFEEAIAKDLLKRGLAVQVVAGA